MLKFWKLDSVTTHFYRSQYTRDQIMGQNISLEVLSSRLINLELWKPQSDFQSVLINHQNHQLIFGLDERLATIVDTSTWLKFSQDSIYLPNDFNSLLSELQAACDLLLISSVHQS